jgi:hypothetical protein
VGIALGRGQRYGKGLPLYLPSFLEKVFSETVPTYFLCSGLHEYSARVTNGNKLKYQKQQYLRPGGQNATENEQRVARVAVLPLGCGCFYAPR